jgi:carboxymethylenebutenolidase
MQAYTRRRFLEGSVIGLAAMGYGLSSFCAQTPGQSQISGLTMKEEWIRQFLAASPRRREWVTVKYDTRSVESIIAYPQLKDKAPVMILVHEVAGLIPWMEKATDEFAEAGFIAIAPDLLSGMAPNGGGTKDFPPAKEPRESLRSQGIHKLSPEQILADLNAVADYAKGLPGCNGKLLVTGFSWGGEHAFRFAERKDLSIVFVFNQFAPTPETIKAVQTPIYGFYAGHDAKVNAAIPQTQAHMKAAGKFYETVMHESADHGFMRLGIEPEGTEANRKARESSWARIKELTAKYK